MKNTLSILLLALSFVSVSFAANQQATESQTTATSATTLAPMSARYELSIAGQATDWFMIRQPNTVITFNAKSQQGEIWQRDQHNDIEHSRIFTEDKKLVEYTNGELKTLNKLPQWAQLASIFAPEKIATLEKTGEQIVLGQRAEVLQGKLSGVPTIIWWLPELQIPARIEQGKNESATVFLMKEMHQQPPASWNWADSAVLNDYARIDASDLGDMESDPFVKKLLTMDGHHH